MSKADLELFLNAAAKAAEKHATSQEAARKFLQSEGLINESGGLSDNYSGSVDALAA